MLDRDGVGIGVEVGQRLVLRHPAAEEVVCERELPRFVGTPDAVADGLEEWFTTEACDGFVVAATHMPGAYDDFVRLGSEARCREAGKLRLEGKDYVVQDGDIIHFRFAV